MYCTAHLLILNDDGVFFLGTVLLATCAPSSLTIHLPSFPHLPNYVFSVRIFELLPMPDVYEGGRA